MAPEPDWDPAAPHVVQDQRAAYDTMREHCPVAHDARSGWTIFRHADVVRVLHDPETFSNVVSSHLSVPNGMDPPEHTAYRRIVESYFSPEHVNAFEPRCRAIAASLVDRACASEEVDLMSTLALPFAAQVQCAYFGWPDSLHERLIGWVRRNHDATLAQDRPAMAAIAREFAALVDELIASRPDDEALPPVDLTAALLRETVQGRPLSTAEVVSILRNWTMGEVGTIAASAGIVAQFLAHEANLQQELRRHPSLLPDAIDEILRIHGPLVSNRRTATRRVEIGGRTIEARERVTINWMAANRDPRVFPEPNAFRPERHAPDNLLYGAGIHVCPGAPLARLELRVVMEELLAATPSIRPVPGRPAIHAMYPASGLASLPLRLQRASGFV